MTEHFSFFDPVLENGLPDRDYNAQQFTDYFESLVTTGLMKGSGNQLIVGTSGSNMVTTIDTGVAFLVGRRYENDSLLSHTHDTETLGKNRIDRIVIRMDLNTDARHVKSFVKKGVASASPVAPALTQTPNVYEISLAQVKVIGGQTFINKVDVVDERGKDIICPWAGSNIFPNFDDTSIGKPNGIAQLDASGKVPASQLDVRPPSDASTSVKGIVKLNDTLISPLTTEAATANAVKQLNDIKVTKNSVTYLDAIIPSFSNGWKSFGGEYACYYFKDPLGIIHFQGYIYGGVGEVGTTLFTVPAGYRWIGSMLANAPNEGVSLLKMDYTTGACSIGSYNSPTSIIFNFDFIPM